MVVIGAVLSVVFASGTFAPFTDSDTISGGVKAATADINLKDDVAAHPALVFDTAAICQNMTDDATDVDAGATAYASTLREHGAGEFDIVMLGIGPDGHIASLFPEAPALYDERVVIPVRGAPKPPPLRISLSAAAINNAREVWLVAAGEEKAGAVRMALEGAGSTQIPAAGVRGKSATKWLLDKAAASKIPVGLTRISSP